MTMTQVTLPKPAQRSTCYPRDTNPPLGDTTDERPDGHDEQGQGNPDPHAGSSGAIGRN